MSGNITVISGTKNVFLRYLRRLWHINLLEEHGVRKYPFGAKGELTLICKPRNSKDEKPKIVFESNIPVELEVIWGEDKSKSIRVSKT